MLLLSSMVLNGTMLCSSRKYPYPFKGRLMEIPRGRGGGGEKAQIFKGKYGTKMEVPEGVGVQA